jgi:benzil reductase ((S)-benzoin forming)
MNKYFITGSSSGLGKALVDILILNDNNHITGISRSNELNHPRFAHAMIDLSDPQSLPRQAGTLFETSSEYGKIYLINNAGYLGPVKYMGEMEGGELQRIFNVNILAPAILSNIFIRKYKGIRAEKYILNISSGASQKPYDGWGGYCSSKAALDMLSQVMAMENEIRGDGFRVVSLAPGIIDTVMQEQLRDTDPENFSRKERFVKLKEENKLLSPADAAKNIIRFLENIDKHREVIQDIRNL